MRNFVHILVAFALVLALTSPACKFISGQWAEICGADGSVKNVFLTGDYLPPELPSKQSHHDKKETCDFCFAQSHVKSLGAASAALVLYTILLSTLIAAWLSTGYKRHELTALSARAPPLF